MLTAVAMRSSSASLNLSKVGGGGGVVAAALDAAGAAAFAAAAVVSAIAAAAAGGAGAVVAAASAVVAAAADAAGAAADVLAAAASAAAGAVVAAPRAGCPALLCGDGSIDEASVHDGHSSRSVQESHLADLAASFAGAVETNCSALPSVHESHPGHGFHLLDDCQAIACVEIQGFKL